MGAISAIPHSIAYLAESIKSPSKALDNSAKSLLSLLSKEQLQKIYKEGEEKNIFPKGTTDKVFEKLDKFNESKLQVPTNISDENRKNALAGKIEKKSNLENELKTTKVEARKIDIQTELEQVNKEIDAIYGGADPMEYEYDSLGNKLKGKEAPYTQTEDGVAVDKEAKELGFDNVTHAINSVNKELGTDYKTFQEIPKEDLQRIAETKLNPTSEEIKLSQNASPEQRAEALKQTKDSYGTSRSTEGVGEPTAPISEDVLSKPIKDIVKSAEPEEQSVFDKWRAERYKSTDEFNSEYEREHLRDYGETKEEFLIRKFCE